MKRFVSQYSQRFRPLWVILTVIVVMSLALVAWGGSVTTAVASTKVPSLGLKRVVHTVIIMENNGRFFFQPSSLTIKVGDIVVWKNVTVVPHTVSSDRGVFNTSGFLSPNKTFRFTFTRAGTFRYHCNIHPYMHGTIIVKSVLASNQGNPTSPPPSAPMPTPTPRSGGGGGGMGGGGGY